MSRWGSAGFGRFIGFAVLNQSIRPQIGTAQAEADGDEDCRSEIVDEENMAGEQLDSDLERWNQIK